MRGDTPVRPLVGVAAAAAATSILVLTGLLGSVAVIAAGDPGLGCSSIAAAGPFTAPSPSATSTIPAALMPIYQQASSRYGLGGDGWAWLASINAEETNFGRDLGTSSAGAIGWMQFLPSTWASYAVDGNGDGRRDPFDPWDAIFTAARYLRTSGAPVDWHRAVLAYNHAEWYFRQVADRARGYGAAPPGAGGVASPAPTPGLQPGGCGSPAGSLLGVDGYALPLQPRYMRPLGRTDDGVDIENAPDGAIVYSITPGTCTAVAGDPSGFGPAYPVIRAASGSLAGRFIYYGHVSRSLVTSGQAITAGQAIAIVGHTGDAASLGHGHIEIGFSDAGGNPLNHHGGGASSATPQGTRMRQVLVALSRAAGIRNR
jgi:murein DD-endopeptidase MepM/ murein hydrolase activator NlpD